MKPIMILGTGSDAGKTVLVAGLCRLFANRGITTAPFKSQNMSLNSYVTVDGGEIARATALQARAARQEPSVHMNPLLLKPKSDDLAQLMVHGKPRMDVSAASYFLTDELQELKLAAIDESIAVLRARCDLIIAEGAGSCAEPNLRRLDVANMGVAHRLGARVFITADIDRGGAFASLLGTLQVLRLTSPSDLDLIDGYLINKFRGDRAVLQPALDFLEAQTNIPVAGVIPFLPDLRLEEEDRLHERRCDDPEIDIAVVYLPHISNATDFRYLEAEQRVQVRYVRSVADLGRPDAIIIPGTKNTTWDLDYIRRIGLEQAILDIARDTQIIGVCGGYQMLGKVLHDPHRLESPLGTVDGMRLLDLEVDFLPQKTLVNRRYEPTADNPFQSAGAVEGYEIHSGQIRLGSSPAAFAYPGGRDGAVASGGLVFGTFIHDLFKNQLFTRTFVDELRRRRGLPALTTPLPNLDSPTEESLERLASELEEHLRL